MREEVLSRFRREADVIRTNLKKRGLVRARQDAVRQQSLTRAYCSWHAHAPTRLPPAVRHPAECGGGSCRDRPPKLRHDSTVTVQQQDLWRRIPTKAAAGGHNGAESFKKEISVMLGQTHADGVVHGGINDCCQGQFFTGMRIIGTHATPQHCGIHLQGYVATMLRYALLR